jgi:hypothetical protein
MTKQEQYVENAVESLELAERLASSSDRRRMLKLAEAWLELANGNDRGLPPQMHNHALEPGAAITATGARLCSTWWTGG